MKLGKNFIEFDLVGVSPSIANAVRRAVTCEVYTTTPSPVVAKADFLVRRAGSYDGYRDGFRREQHFGDPR